MASSPVPAAAAPAEGQASSDPKPFDGSEPLEQPSGAEPTLVPGSPDLLASIAQSLAVSPTAPGFVTRSL
jgi:hypothetical protein